MKKSKKINKTNIIIFLIILVVLTTGVFASFLSYNTKEEKIKYEDNGNVRYKVYLEKNNFFDEPYLDMNRVYITSLIDYVNADFTYNILFSKPCSGKYSYNIKGVLSADTTNDNGNYWSKTYVLSDIKEKEFKNLNVVNINENIKIDYNKYNDLLMEFKKEYGLSMNGSLKVYLDIETNINDKDKTVKHSNLPSLTIPLTQATIEVPIKVDKAASVDIVKMDNNEKIIMCYKIVEIICFVIALLGILYLIYVRIKKENLKNLYKNKLKKILKTYDGIIVNIDAIPVIKNIPIIEVQTFEELLDAHGEVRLPINYIGEKDKAIFMLISETMIWRYTLDGKELRK